MMPQPSRHAHPYKVTKQVQGTTFNPDGTSHKSWTVHVEHADGTPGTVEMPDAVYSAPNVHNAIAYQAEAVHEVANLPESLPAAEAREATGQ